MSLLLDFGSLFVVVEIVKFMSGKESRLFGILLLLSGVVGFGMMGFCSLSFVIVVFVKVS